MAACAAADGSDPGDVLADLFESMYLQPSSRGPTESARLALGQLSQPVLSLYSTNAAARLLADVDLPPGSRIECWPGTTHYLHMERPAAFAALLDEWLELL